TALPRQALGGGGVTVERVAGEEEAEGAELLLQPLGREPRLDMAEYKRLARRAAGEQFRLPDRHVIIGALCGREHGVDGREYTRAISFECIEGAGGSQALQHALGHRARVDAGGEIGE